MGFNGGLLLFIYDFMTCKSVIGIQLLLVGGWQRIKAKAEVW